MKRLFFIVGYLILQLQSVCLRKSCRAQALCQDCSQSDGDGCSNIMSFIEEDNNCIVRSYNSQQQCQQNCSICYNDYNNILRCVLCNTKNANTCLPYVADKIVAQDDNQTFDAKQYRDLENLFYQKDYEYFGNKDQYYLEQLIYKPLDYNLHSNSYAFKILLTSLGEILIIIFVFSQKQALMRIIINAQIIWFLSIISNKTNSSGITDTIISIISVVYASQNLKLNQNQYSFISSLGLLVLLGCILCSTIIILITKCIFLREKQDFNSIFLVFITFELIMFTHSISVLRVNNNNIPVIVISFLVILVWVVMFLIGLKYYQNSTDCSIITKQQYIIYSIYLAFCGLCFGIGFQHITKYFILSFHFIVTILTIVLNRGRLWNKVSQLLIGVCFINIIFIFSSITLITLIGVYLISLGVCVNIKCKQPEQSMNSRVQKQNNGQINSQNQRNIMSLDLKKITQSKTDRYQMQENIN